MRIAIGFVLASLCASGLSYGAESAPRGDYDIVIIGGGPSGNVSALKLAQAGKRVLVVEKRTAERTRKQIVGIKGLSNGVLDGVDLGLDTSRTARYAPRPDADPHTEPSTSAAANPVKHMVEAFSTHTITIGDLEKQLLGACSSNKDIDLSYKSELTKAPVQHEDGSLELEVRGADGQVHKVRSGYMIVSDGAGSNTLKMLGIGTKTNAKGTVAAAFFGQRGRNILDYGEGVARVADNDRTYTLTGLTPEQEQLTGKDLEQVIRSQGKKVGIKRDAPILKSWTFPATMQHADKLTAMNGHVFVQGDAASTPHPLTGMGVNKAIYEAEATASTIDKLIAAPDEATRGAEIRNWKRTMFASRNALHEAALPIFEKYGTIEKAPKYLTLPKRLAASAQARRAK